VRCVDPEERLLSALVDERTAQTHQRQGNLTQKKIWIDLDNSPHVPFFKPIIEELEGRGYSVILTARDCFQVSDLLTLFNMRCKPVGRHYGKNTILKLGGLCFRALQMTPTILREKPDLALSHGSRAQLLASAVLGVPSVTLLDYEYVTGWMFIRPTWVMVPEIVPENAIKIDRNRIVKYPGIKEDVYVPNFNPDPTLKGHLGLNGEELLVTVRPPATEAHYHKPQSDELFEAVIEFLGPIGKLRIVIVPRNQKQARLIKKTWSRWCTSQKILVLDQVVDGLSLIWHSDFVISGGGTMNREAAALGVPVYSIFRGQTGAVDRYLADSGRLVLLESLEDVRTKILPKRRAHPSTLGQPNRATLNKIVNEITRILEC
jgi:predicted glycosyltransferase